jgi:hypothetical protein
MGTRPVVGGLSVSPTLFGERDKKDNPTYVLLFYLSVQG